MERGLVENCKRSIREGIPLPANLVRVILSFAPRACFRADPAQFALPIDVKVFGAIALATALAGRPIATALEVADLNLSGLFTGDGNGSQRFGDQQKLLPLGLKRQEQ
jgi:hypothetical protein